MDLNKAKEDYIIRNLYVRFIYLKDIKKLQKIPLYLQNSS